MLMDKARVLVIVEWTADGNLTTGSDGLPCEMMLEEKADLTFIHAKLGGKRSDSTGRTC
jgi:hypothetical protein